MASRQEIQEKLQDIFDVFFLQPVKLTPALSAPEVPGWDSLTHILLVVEVEKVFGIKFQVGEVGGLKNVGEFMDLISKRLPG